MLYQPKGLKTDDATCGSVDRSVGFAARRCFSSRGSDSLSSRTQVGSRTCRNIGLWALRAAICRHILRRQPGADESHYSLCRYPGFESSSECGRHPGLCFTIHSVPGYRGGKSEFHHSGTRCTRPGTDTPGGRWARCNYGRSDKSVHGNAKHPHRSVL